MTVQADPEVVRVGVIRWIVKSVIFGIILGLVLFLTGDDWGWRNGWLYMLIYAVNQVLLGIVLPKELLAERSQRQQGSKSWDTVLASFAALFMPLLTYLVAGLDHRFAWSQTAMPQWLWIMALVLMIGGIAFTSWAMISNAFFSGLVRIQEDRGHTVVSDGPYKVVRHPGYVGAILHHVAAPIVLSSWWALIPGVTGAVLMVIRTAMEDRTLHDELEGYADYAEETPHRLAPGIW